MKPSLRMAPLFLAITLIAAGNPPSPVEVSVHAQRASFDLLDSLPIAVVVHNRASVPVAARFPAPAEYFVEVLHDASPVWTTQTPAPPPGVTFPPHQRVFGPGPTTLVVQAWNELAQGGWSPAAGRYVVRVRLLTPSPQPSATLAIVFEPPLPPGSLASLRAGQPVTLTGRLDSTHAVLTDGAASAVLSRRLLQAPADFPVVVRGYATDRPDGTRTFSVDRWAPYGAPAPLPTASPTPRPRTSVAPLAIPTHGVGISGP